MEPEFDEDIEEDYREGHLFRLACVAQDLRDLMSHVNNRSLLAAIKRKQKAEGKTKGEANGTPRNRRPGSRARKAGL